MFNSPAAQSPPPGPPPGDDGKPEPAWIGFLAVLLMASPGLVAMGILLGAFYLCK